MLSMFLKELTAATDFLAIQFTDNEGFGPHHSPNRSRIIVFSSPEEKREEKGGKKHHMTLKWTKGICNCWSLKIAFLLCENNTYIIQLKGK